MTIVRTALIVILAHCLILSLVWVGFPVPVSREGMNLSYAGSFVPARNDPDGDAFSAGQSLSRSLPIKIEDAPSFDPWARMRGLDKPRK